MAILSPSPKLQFFDANGNPLVGGKLYSYTAGTTSPLATYTDSTNTSANTNPIILDSRGEASVWLGADAYKLALYSATDILIWSVDNITSTSFQTIGNAITFTPPAGVGSTYNIYNTGSALAFTDGANQDQTANTERLRIDASGNLGIGLAPSAWGSNYKALEITGLGSAIAANGSNTIIVGTGSYFNSSGQNIYTVTGTAASRYVQASGQHVWAIAQSGTSGSPASFSQSMTLDVNGVFNVAGTSIGTTWAPSTFSAGICITKSSNDNYVTSYLDTTSVTIGAGISQKTGIGIFGQTHANGNYIALRTGNAERMRLDASGNLGVGTAAPVNKVDIVGSLGRGAPVTKTADFTLASTENWVINNKPTTTCTVTLPAASSWTGREVMFLNYQAFTLVSASANVVPRTGGAASTAILPATAGSWATLVSNGTNWLIMASS